MNNIRIGFLGKAFMATIVALVFICTLMPMKAYAIFNSTKTMYPESGIVLVGDSRVYMLEDAVGSGASMSAVVGGHYGWTADGDIISDDRKAHLLDAITQSIAVTGQCQVFIFGTINDSPDVRSQDSPYIQKLVAFGDECKNAGASVTIVSNVPSTSMSVDSYNGFLANVAAEHGFPYLDITGIITPDCYAGDGVHYNNTGSTKLWNYISSVAAGNVAKKKAYDMMARKEMTKEFNEIYGDRNEIAEEAFSKTTLEAPYAQLLEIEGAAEAKIPEAGDNYPLMILGVLSFAIPMLMLAMRRRFFS